MNTPETEAEVASRDLFGWAVSRNSDPDTSATAAESVRGTRANELESKVLNVLTEHPEGLTGQEVTDILGMDRVTTSPRFAPLKRKGLIYDSGERRKGPSNRPAIVWKPNVKGLTSAKSNQKINEQS